MRTNNQNLMSEGKKPSNMKVNFTFKPLEES